MSERDPVLLIDDMLESARKILSYSKDLSFEQFVENDLVADAVIRNFEIIGEAASRMPESFKENHPQVPWARLKGFRNRLIHEYFGIDYSIIWDIIEFELFELIRLLKEIR